MLTSFVAFWGLVLFAFSKLIACSDPFMLYCATRRVCICTISVVWNDAHDQLFSTALLPFDQTPCYCLLPFYICWVHVCKGHLAWCDGFCFGFEMWWLMALLWTGLVPFEFGCAYEIAHTWCYFCQVTHFSAIFGWYVKQKKWLVGVSQCSMHV